MPQLVRRVWASYNDLRPHQSLPLFSLVTVYILWKPQIRCWNWRKGAEISAFGNPYENCLSLYIECTYTCLRDVFWFQLLVAFKKHVLFGLSDPTWSWFDGFTWRGLYNGLKLQQPKTSGLWFGFIEKTPLGSRVPPKILVISPGLGAAGWHAGTVSLWKSLEFAKKTWDLCLLGFLLDS